MTADIEISECRLDGSIIVARGRLAGNDQVDIELRLNLWGPGVVELRLTCEPNSADGITDGFMRSLRLPAIRRAVLSRVAAEQVRYANDGSRVNLVKSMAAQATAGLAKGELSAKADAGSYKWNDERLRAVAIEAVRFLTVSKGQGSVRAHLAGWLGESPDTARDVISKARRRGFLAPTKNGYREVQAGPRLTDDDLRTIAVNGPAEPKKRARATTTQRATNKKGGN